MRVAKDIVKLRDRKQCQRCGGEGNECSHVIEVARSKRMSIDPMNMLFLCSECHRRRHHSPLKALEWYKKEWSKRWEYLEEEFKIVTGTIGIFWLERKLEEMKEQKYLLSKRNG